MSLNDGLLLSFNSLIPEAANANNVTGYPGAYAVGNYWSVLTANLNYKVFFIDYSTQSLNTVLNQVVYDFTGILYSDTTVTANSYEIFVDSGNGWIKLASTGYAVTNQGGVPRVTLANALPVGQKIKFELLF